MNHPESHPFGDLISQYLHRKHGLSQSKLAEGILQSPAIISEMCRGRRLTGPQARERVVAILIWLHQQGVLGEPDGANALLAAAGMSVLNEHDALEAKLLTSLHSNPISSAPSVSLSRREVARNNLPKPLTSLVGRADEIADLARLLSSAMLLSLIGVGGVGKTRLAQEVGRYVLERYPWSVWYIQLAALTDPALIARTIAQTLRLPERSERTDIDLLTDYFEDREALLILDNCEHLLKACAEMVNQLLQTCPRLRVLVTSREALNISAEMLWQVTSLNLSAASQLFLDRAHMVQPRFVQTDQTATMIAQICTRLDGLPLAIELAVSRLSGLSLEQIISRLDDRFALLTQGSRTALPRHQTLRAMIDWSHDLLTGSEQILLRRLAVFSGGWTLEAAEVVCAEAGGPLVMDLHIGLVQKSLVVMEHNTVETRYYFLETIGEYALEKLKASGDLENMHQRHSAYLLQLTRMAEPHLHSHQQKHWLDRLEREHDNLRAALRWSQSETGDPAHGLQLAVGLWQFWWMHGHLNEGRRWISALFDPACSTTPPNLRAWALLGAGMLGMEYYSYQGYDQAVPHQLEEAYTLLQVQGDAVGIALSLCQLGHLATSPTNPNRDNAHGQALLEESLAISRRQKTDSWIATHALFALANMAYWQSNLVRSGALFEECFTLARQLGDKRMMANSLNDWADVVCAQLDFVRSAAMSEEALGILREIGDSGGQVNALRQLAINLLLLGKLDQSRSYFEELYRVCLDQGSASGIATALGNLGLIARDQGDYLQATSYYKESLHWFHNKSGFAASWAGLSVLGLGTVASAQGQHQRAARLFGAVEAWQQSLNVLRLPHNQILFGQHIDATRAQLGDAVYEAAFVEGQAMISEQVYQYAFEEGRW